jgi:hypothetical protein
VPASPVHWEAPIVVPAAAGKAGEPGWPSARTAQFQRDRHCYDSTLKYQAHDRLKSDSLRRTALFSWNYSRPWQSRPHGADTCCSSAMHRKNACRPSCCRKHIHQYELWLKKKNNPMASSTTQYVYHRHAAMNDSFMMARTTFGCRERFVFLQKKTRSRGIHIQCGY